MTLQAKLALWAASVVVVMGAIAGISLAGAHYQSGKDEASHQVEVNAIQQVVLQQAVENDTLKTRLEVKKNEEDAVVDQLANHPVVTSLRLPEAIYPGQGNAATGGQTVVAGAWPLPIDPNDALEAFTAGLAKLALEADQVTAQCRVVTSWAAAQILPTTGANK